MIAKKDLTVPQKIESAEKSMEKKLKTINFWAVSTFVLAILLLSTIAWESKITGQAIGTKQAGEKVVSLFNTYFVQTGGVTLSDVTEESGLYKVTLSYEQNPIAVYMTRDGKSIIDPKGMISIDELVKSASQKDNTATSSQPRSVPKLDKPVVELFVMSHCPYGTQVEKGIIPVVETLKDKIDFKVNFVYYAMHGQNELNEELTQYCIQKEQPGKFIAYLSAFLEKGESAASITKAGVDKTKLDACVKATDSEFKVTEKFNDKTTWLNGRFPLFDVNKALNTKYSVGGSPTLIINGVQSTAGRDSTSLLNAICAAFNTAPSECATKLSSTTPDPGFGYTSSGNSGTTASCG